MKKRLSLLLMAFILLMPTTIFAAPDNTNNTSSAGVTAKDEEALPQKLQDLQAYADMLTPIEAYETTALKAYQKYPMVTTSNRKDVYSSLTNAVIPNYKKVVTMVSKVKAPNAELQSIHNLMIKGSQLQLEGFTLLKEAVYKKKSLAPANNKLEAGRKLVNQYTVKINEYVDKYSN
ncbi:hypothetical protein [Paenibacillus sp.]|jgi:hypothetical protein|uniref:hypothetical protein n=1 Tax=Paenibacillus sp. TaxID=58172 RepID=UPI0028361547|nr:hypothetical protein [Paenibacillus sp.]MDR0271253.1 hypothetical protein [Paenibacillus sp.]